MRLSRILLSVVICSSTSIAGRADSNAGIRTSELGHPAPGSHFQILSTPKMGLDTDGVITAALTQAVHKNIAKGALLKGSEFSLLVSAPFGYLVFKQQTTSSPDRISRFYAEQAVWDVDPALYDGLKETRRLEVREANVGPDSQELIGAAADRKSCVQVLIIPLSAIAICKQAQLNECDLNSTDNIRCVSIHNLNSPLLAELRRLRTDFLKSQKAKNATKGDVLKEQVALKKQFHRLFQ